MKNILACLVLLAVAFQSQGQTLDEIKAKAEKGDALFQAILGQSYRRGELGLPVDKEQARKWIEKSAASNNPLGLANKGALDDDNSYEKKALDSGLIDLANKGNPWCQRMIGCFYDNGSGGLEKNPAEAVKWYRKAAEQGNADAQYNLGYALATGKGVPEDKAEAVKWFRKAAEQGNAYGQASLGYALATGKGVPEDKAEAVKWFRKLVENKNKKLADAAKEALKDPALAVHVVKQEAGDIVDNLSKTITDAEPEKYGGPKTPIVIRLALGGQKGDAAGNLAVMVQGKMASRFKEIKRGQPLTSLISVKIPTGTKVYPIRLVISEEAGSVDYYFYKDEFGDWAAVEK